MRCVYGSFAVLLALLSACGGNSVDDELAFDSWDGTFALLATNTCDRMGDPVEQAEPALMDFATTGPMAWTNYLANISAVSSQPFDPDQVTIRSLGSVAGSNKFHGGVLAPDGTIYYIPSSLPLVYYYHPDDGVLRNFAGVGAVNHAWNGGVLGPNGKIYSIPFWSAMCLSDVRNSKE